MHKKLIPTKKTLSKVNIGISKGRGNLPLLNLLNKTNNKIEVPNKQYLHPKINVCFFKTLIKKSKQRKKK